MVRLTTSVRYTKDQATNEKMVNQYRLLSEVGRGTYSKVRWAEDTNGARMYAMKVWSKPALGRRHVAHFDEGGASTVAMSVIVDEELRLLGELNHRHVLSLEEVIDDPGHENLYAVLEGLPGADLMTWNQNLRAYTARQQPLAVRQYWGEAVRLGDSGDDLGLAEVVVFREGLARYLMRQTLEGLAYLHERGVIHKDLKPDNILLSMPVPTGDPRFVQLLSLAGWPAVARPRAVGRAAPSAAPEPGEEANAALGEDTAMAADGTDAAELVKLLDSFALTAKIGDFNTAVVCKHPDCRIYDAQGTVLFTAPECFGDHPAGVCGKPRDVWSLGCVLFNMLFGKCPFWSEENITLQLTIMQCDLQLPDCRAIGAPGAEDLIRSLMREDPDQRFSAIEALRHSWIVGGVLATASSG